MVAVPIFRAGMVNLPLHYGKAPPWLFNRMKNLAREITIAVVMEFGPQEMLRRLSDPSWFQSFGCLLGFDWHSSGLTTTVCGALKEGWRGMGKDLGIFIAGGKGKVSRQTPGEIDELVNRYALNPDPAHLIYMSKMVAKVDNAALQDGYQLYHHCFIFTSSGDWCVIQQGMNETIRYARRYHWLSEKLKSLVCEPHTAICCDTEGRVLNLVAEESAEARRVIAILSGENPDKLVKSLHRIKLLEFPTRHHIEINDLHPEVLYKIFLKTYENPPREFTELLSREGIGPKTLRALALIADLIYGVPVSSRDPVTYSFAHGGKDGHPYPVDQSVYDQSIELFKQAVSRAKLGQQEKLEALKRLRRFGKHP